MSILLVWRYRRYRRYGRYRRYSRYRRYRRYSTPRHCRLPFVIDDLMGLLCSHWLHMLDWLLDRFKACTDECEEQPSTFVRICFKKRQHQSRKTNPPPVTCRLSAFAQRHNTRGSSSCSLFSWPYSVLAKATNVRLEYWWTLTVKWINWSWPYQRRQIFH